MLEAPIAIEAGMAASPQYAGSTDPFGVIVFWLRVKLAFGKFAARDKENRVAAI